MTTRTLPPSEWDRVAESGLPDLLRHVAPGDAAVVVVEDGDVIAGAWAVVKVTHLEGLWIAPAYRHRLSVAKALKNATLSVARAWASWVAVWSDRDEISRMLTRHLHATRAPVDTFIVEMEK